MAIRNHTLKTQMQVAERRAAQIAKAHARAAWAARLDAASYRCHREGAAWVADGPAGQSFRFSRMASGEVECHSATSGMSYIIRREGAGWSCSCPCNGANDKHLAAWMAVLMAHRMARIETRTALQAEGAELARLRAEGECAERACRAEWAVANGAGL